MSDSIWISPFIEHCLSSYQTEETLRPDRELTWEDDGSNIRFPSSAHQNALINDWNQGDNLPTAKLTDSDTQIDAILSRGSLDEYEKAFPREPLSKDRCRGFLMQLDTFELVYEYSTGKPNVHLYIKRFNIIWDRGKTKSPPTGKIIRKKPALSLLMRQVYTQTKSRDQQAKRGSDGGFGDKHAIQASNSYAYASTQAHLLSQLPSHLSANSDPSHDLVYDASLSQNVPRPEPESLRLNRERYTETQSLNRSSVPVGVGHSRGRSDVSTTSNKLPGSSRTQESEKTTEIQLSPVKKHVESRPVRAQVGTGHPSAREVISPEHVEPEPLDQPIERRDSPYSPEKQLNSQLHASQSVTLRPRNPTTTHQSVADPWEGMAGIKSVDVTVPEDQAELLGHAGKNQWYPPLPGLSTISGHVPPALLHEWNMFVLQRRQRATGSGLNPSEAAGPSEHDTPSTESDSDGSRSSISWESSPERTPRRGMALPVDSSPIAGRSVSREPQQKSPDSHEGTSKHEISNSRVPNEIRPPSETGQDQGLNVAASSKLARTGPTAENVPPTVAYGNDRRDSDISSSDSEMDIVMPQPLSGSTQQGSQVEPEISSSGPVLPEPSRRIQVVETPSAALHKSRTMIFNQNGAVTGSTNPKVSPCADKSSSQSRILNTYTSHDGDSKGETSQDTHVADTPISGQVLQTRDSTSHSQSGSLLTSSAPKSTESNVAIAVSTHQSQSSNAFSSYREFPSSSMLSVEEQQQSPSIQSFAHASPLIPTSALPLKRGASEIEVDGDTSPSKRTKPDQKSMVSEAETEVDAKLRCRNFRFQECINSAQSIAAKQVYERFCGNYPAYYGDYAHFTKLCSQLQAFRALGSLQRSFLWDDFIIKHLEEYPIYRGECMAKETNPLPYEQFFVTSFSRPTHKRRILSAEAIDACAAQVITIDETPMVSSSDPTTDTKVSFTSSIRDQLSNLHTYSFAATQEPESQDTQLEATQDDNDTVSDYSIPDSEPIRAAAPIVTPEIPEDFDNNETIEDAEDMDDTVHETASVELGDEESTRVRTTSSDDESMDDPLGDSLANDANFALDVTLDNQPGKSFDGKAGEAGREGRDHDDDDDTDDVDEHEHETIAPIPAQPATAPINEEEDEVEETQEDELKTTISTRRGADVEEIKDDDDKSEVAGDTAANAPVEVNEVGELAEEAIDDQVDETASDSDPEELDSDPSENWFLALRNIHPNEPVWSDDANTPFKKWAQADQNVFSVRHRRGGANVSTDEKGVIQRMNHTRR
ncbi:hypothetical protein HK57_00482 [Aspergillus ustus]|uniref:Telomere replication protein EST3 n=1 Tax=Aspergillus ustus TaxID=40382 RepID=A0A0C1E2I7_ASPUT|nr:hypothetical protein HK57_00482 [Aspergillus ustus]